MYIFYDIETTGTDAVYDQILQFGAILADDNLTEIDRFETRCRLLPWVVPAPSALLVTQTAVGRLTDSQLPDFYSMIRGVAERLAKWSPATFIGYNSIRFDEPFLQRAFWQALLPPYLTVTRGNARLDLLPLIRATAFFRPDLLHLPLREDGLVSFRLDGLAPANGFNAHSAHDAMGDVEATLFLARLIAIRFPELWQPLVMRASKASSAALLAQGTPIFHFNHSATPPVGFYQRIDKGAGRGAHAVLAHLGYDWRASKAKIENFDPDEIAEMQKALRRVALNKAPLVFTLAEAAVLAGLAPAPAELLQSHFLSYESDYGLRLAAETEPRSHVESGDSEVEDTIFNGFASLHDERLMEDFRNATPREQATIARAFDDLRFRRLAQRILFLTQPQVLTSREEKIMRLGIIRRLAAPRDDPHPWRSIPDALGELTGDPQKTLMAEKNEISRWLQQRLENL